MKPLFFPKKWKKNAYLSIFFLMAVFNGLAQGVYLNPNHPAYHIFDRLELQQNQHSSFLHSSLKPYNTRGLVRDGEARYVKPSHLKKIDLANLDYLFRDHNEYCPARLVRSKKPILKHFYRYPADFLRASDSSKFVVRANPVLHFELGKELNGQGIQYINRRGGEIRGLIADKVAFYTVVTENQRSFANPFYEKLVQDSAIPGEGRYLLFASGVGDDLFSRNGVDYFSARGYIDFQIIDEIGIQWGHDRNFIGNGMRSLFLSDHSAPYFFLKLNTKVWKLHYQNLFMEMTGRHDYLDFDGLRPKKYASIHHLSINVHKKLNLGFFESVVYGRDTGFELNYLNPLIFYRAVEHTLGSPDNVMIGLDWKYLFVKKWSFYGQILLDEYSFSKLFSGTGWFGNKFGIQAGIKGIDLFTIPNLDIQGEFNLIRPFTYSHDTDIPNYSHYNQPLAHPLGANFMEFLGVLRYQPRPDVFLKANVLYAVQGLNVDTINYGADIFVNTSFIAGNQREGHFFLQGNQQTTFLADFTLSWMWKHNVFFDLYARHRRTKSDLAPTWQASSMVSLGMRVNLMRRELLF